LLLLAAACCCCLLLAAAAAACCCLLLLAACCCLLLLLQISASASANRNRYAWQALPKVKRCSSKQISNRIQTAALCIRCFANLWCFRVPMEVNQAANIDATGASARGRHGGVMLAVAAALYIALMIPPNIDRRWLIVAAAPCVAGTVTVMQSYQVRESHLQCRNSINSGCTFVQDGIVDAFQSC
jgi:hypothetical protein